MIKSGLALPDGVIFWQEDRCVKAYRNKKTDRIHLEIKDRNWQENDKKLNLLKALFLPSAIGSVYLLNLQMEFLKSYFPDLWSRILVSPGFTLEFYALLLLGFTLGNKIFCSELTAYHAVEHKVINLYNKKKNNFTLKELKKASRYSRYCGGRFLIALILIDAFIYAPGCIFWQGFYGNAFFNFAGLFLFLPFFKLCFSSSKVRNKLIDRGNWILQMLVTTKKPKDKQLEVGLAALHCLYS